MSSGLVNPPRIRRPGSSQDRSAPPWKPPWLCLTLVALCFGIIEAILVAVYRTLLDPQGDLFPLVLLPRKLLAWERWREAATLLLLAGTARLAAPPRRPAWAAFFYAFAIWDLVYYATLRAALGWPDGLTDWDLLFLLPTPWLAPVYAPLLVSMLLLGVGALSLRFASKRGSFRVGPGHVAAALMGAGLGVWSFVASPDARALRSLPTRYPVELLLAGLVLGSLAYVHAYRANLRRDAAARELSRVQDRR